jgi:predicted membrane-bound dolichyl-phosphate-mannose-protein mannosyltransferase
LAVTISASRSVLFEAIKSLAVTISASREALLAMMVFLLSNISESTKSFVSAILLATCIFVLASLSLINLQFG